MVKLWGIFGIIPKNKSTQTETLFESAFFGSKLCKIAQKLFGVREVLDVVQVTLSIGLDAQKLGALFSAPEQKLHLFLFCVFPFPFRSHPVPSSRLFREPSNAFAPVFFATAGFSEVSNQSARFVHSAPGNNQ